MPTSCHNSYRAPWSEFNCATYAASNLCLAFQLHASDLRSSLGTGCRLSKSLSKAPSSRQFPYARRSNEPSMSDLAAALATRCDAILTSGVQSFESVKGKKHIIHADLPILEGSGGYRKSAMVEYGTKHSIVLHIRHTLITHYRRATFK